MKNLLNLAAIVCFCAIAARAQTAPATTPATSPASSDSSLQDLALWLATQQAQVGTSIGFSKTKYVVTWWDAVSYGTSGFNVAAAGSQDLVDIGFGTALANGAKTRYCAFLPIHGGNLWNAAANHSGSNLKLSSAPSIVFGVDACFPTDGRLNTWRFDNDGQVMVAYRFGGSN